MPSRNLLSRYIWLIDTITRYGRITRHELEDLWLKSSVGNGEPLSRRTFYNYRQGIEQLFNITIGCDNTTFEYFISNADKHSRSVTDWLLNSSAVSNVLSNSRDISHRIFLEDVPSARGHLDTVINALRASRAISFDYNNFTRSRPATGLRLEPYVLKFFRQRWYVVGLNIKEKKLKTYALDRMANCVITSTAFALPDGFDPDAYFRDSFGIVVTHQPPREIVIRTDHLQAKYLRALPLHHSQQESLHDGFSLFSYRMRLTDDLVEYLLSMGPRITVIAPAELRAMMVDRLQRTLDNYRAAPDIKAESSVTTPLRGRAALKK